MVDLESGDGMKFTHRFCLWAATESALLALLWVPNGLSLSCGRLAPRRKRNWAYGRCRPGTNTPFPLNRSAPASFKRMLGRTPGHRMNGERAGAIVADFPAIRLKTCCTRVARMPFSLPLRHSMAMPANSHGCAPFSKGRGADHTPPPLMP